ncbi:MAG TPA: helix-turn-helix transcriptional regulator [Thermoflexia bacterium]|jgi:transcriptional regulator with XRE-family HTH domain|nr:helix-turn-helix transcriptional regulator [Thermoflexia bacterium]
MSRASATPSFDGRRLRALRKARGLSVGDLSTASGISPRHIWRLESGGRSDLRAATLIRLALALRTSTDYLLGLTDDPGGGDESAGHQPKGQGWKEMS